MKDEQFDRARAKRRKTLASAVDREVDNYDMHIPGGEELPTPHSDDSYLRNLGKAASRVSQAYGIPMEEAARFAEVATPEAAAWLAENYSEAPLEKDIRVLSDQLEAAESREKRGKILGLYVRALDGVVLGEVQLPEEEVTMSELNLSRAPEIERGFSASLELDEGYHREDKTGQKNDGNSPYSSSHLHEHMASRMDRIDDRGI